MTSDNPIEKSVMKRCNIFDSSCGVVGFLKKEE